MNDSRVLDISWGTILKVAFASLVFYVLYQIKDILILIIFSVIFSLLFNPVIDFLETRKIPRIVSVLFIYLVVFGAISLFFYLTIPFFIQEIQQLLQIFPQYFEKISPPLRGLGIETFKNFESLIAVLGKNLEQMAANIFNALFVIFGGIFSTLFVLTLSIFLSLEEKAVEKALTIFFPKRYETYVLELWENCQRKVSGWFGTRIVACLFVGLLSYFTFFLFNIKYSFSLGLLAGILNFIPLIGPILTGVVIFLIISFDSITKAIFALIAFTLIQQLENNILTPILTKKFIGLSPVLVLISLAVGGKLGGILGAILAVPLAGVLFEFLRDFLSKKREEEAEVL